MKPESWEQRARRLDRFHRRGLRWLIVGALALLAAGVVLIIWDGSGLTHRCIRIVDAWDLTGDCPSPSPKTDCQLVPCSRAPVELAGGLFRYQWGRDTTMPR
jgi:hypothetical protein